MVKLSDEFAPPRRCPLCGKIHPMAEAEIGMKHYNFIVHSLSQLAALMDAKAGMTGGTFTALDMHGDPIPGLEQIKAMLKKP